MTPHLQARLQMLTDDGMTEVQALGKMLVEAEGLVASAYRHELREKMPFVNAELLLILTALAKKLGNTTGLMRTP